MVEQVALKTLIVIHRILREGDPTFREELLNYSQRGHILQLSNFKDDSSPLGKVFTLDGTSSRAFMLASSYFPVSLNREVTFSFAAWDCSAWVRTYALFLEERLESFRVLKYDIEAERLTKSGPGASKVGTFTEEIGYFILL